VLDSDSFDIAEAENNPFFWPNASQVDELAAFMQKLSKDGDSAGARVNVVASGVPVGWGEPVFDRLDADIAHAMMSIGAVGSEHRDQITPDGFLSNNAGGVLGGISSGQDVTVSVALKPTSSLRLPGRTVDVNNEAQEVVTTGRHDPCVGIRATPIAEAMLALVLIDHCLRDRAQNPGMERRSAPTL